MLSTRETLLILVTNFLHSPCSLRKTQHDTLGLRPRYRFAQFAGWIGRSHVTVQLNTGPALGECVLMSGAGMGSIHDLPLLTDYSDARAQVFAVHKASRATRSCPRQG